LNDTPAGTICLDKSRRVRCHYGVRPGARLLWIFALAASLGAQASFEASVRQNLGDVPESVSLQPTGVRLTGFRLRTLITIAYGPEAGIQTFDQLIGGPSWLAADRFDIVAKTDERLVAGPDGRRPDLIPAVLKAVLAERFHLQVHTEEREMPVYALRRVRADGTAGPQLRPSSIECPPLVIGVPSQPPDPARWCGIRSLAGSVRGQHVAMGTLAGWLAGLPVVGRPVVDRTDMRGNYDLRLDLEPDAADIFTALREQLGVALQSEHASMPVIVIDRAEHPTPD